MPLEEFWNIINITCMYFKICTIHIINETTKIKKNMYDTKLSCDPLCDVIIFMHDDIIKWKHLPRYWPFVRAIHRSPVNSPHKGQWRGALLFSLICVWINGWVNNHEASDLRRHLGHYDVTVMSNISLILQIIRRIGSKCIWNTTNCY